MLANNTCFTREALEVTIQATISRAVYATRVAGGKGRVGKTLMHHEFIGKLLFVLKPILEVILGI